MATPEPRRISEIEGLRGLALTLVVLFHLFGQGRVSGGVDVFLFVSGFLLTLTMLRGWTAARPFNLAHRYTRMAVRLTPAALLVLAATAVMTVVLLPAASWMQTARELIASALYYENWELISSQLAYGAAGPETSPVQHFWSLSVQGQFFLVWPVALAALLLVGRRRPWSGPFVTIVIGVLTVASFGYAVWLNVLEPQVAYFDSFSRFWEIGAGALLAAGFTAVNRIPNRARAFTGWAGVALIVGSGFVVDGATMFPGPAALLPVSGAALVIASSGAPTTYGVDRALSTRPMRFIARISYPLYLWHWPILIAYLALRSYDTVGLLGGGVVLLIAGLLAWLTQRFLVEPSSTTVARAPRGRHLVAAAAALVAFTTVVGTGATAVDGERRTALAAAASSAEHPGAMALTAKVPVPEDIEPLPDAASAYEDLPEVYSEGCVQNHRDRPEYSAVLICAPRGSADSPIEIVLTGGSHALQWADAFTTIAETHGWRLTIIDKDGCRLRLSDSTDDLSCTIWNQEAIRVISDLQPTAVITVSTTTSPGGTEYLDDGQVAAWTALNDAGIPVIAVRDTPRFEWRVPECLGAFPNTPDRCGALRKDVYADVSPTLSSDGLPSSVVELDLSDGFCRARCEAVVGNVVIYRDDNHMTASYARTLTALLDERLRANARFLYH